MTALLLDAFSLFFRAYHALPPMNASDGLPTNALYGFTALLLKLLREQQPNGVALALDTPQPTFRHAQYAEYKAERQRPASELVQQLPALDELMAAFDFPVHRAPGYEADDVLATLAREIEASGVDVLIVSGDRDLLQLVRDSVRVLFVGRRGRPPQLYDEAAVLRRFELRPDQLPSYVALVGDPSDNLPGVPGIGERTATRLVRTYGSIAELLRRTAEIPPGRLREALEGHRAQIERNAALARLRDDLDLGSGARLAPLRAAALVHVRALLERLEFKSLLPRLERLAGQAPAD